MKKLLSILFLSYVAILLVFYLSDNQENGGKGIAGNAEDSPQITGDKAQSLMSDKDYRSDSGASINTSNLIPSSIPLDQAAYYHLPEEQRSPGNIGGPPPFPGSSSSPNIGQAIQPSVITETSTGISPPVSPVN